MSDLKVGMKRSNKIPNEVFAKRKREAETINDTSGDATTPTQECEADKADETLPDEAVFYLRIIYMLIDLGTGIVLKAFLHLIKPEDVVTFLKSEECIKKLKDLKRRAVLNPNEYDLVVESSDPKNFDISLLLKLMIKLFPEKVHLPQNPKAVLNKPLNQIGSSLADDLRCLRKVRNEIVAHQPRARIPERLFHKVWQQTEDSILNITSQCMPDQLDDVKKTIEKYKNRRFDSSDGKQYKDILEAWFAEIGKCQQRVEEMLGKLEGYELYYKSKSYRNGNFRKYLQLLTKGGHLVLCGVLERELRNQDIGLKSLLDRKKSIICENVTDSRWLKLLFSEDECDASEWEIVLLAEVLLIVFDTSLNLNEKTEIKKIKNAMSNYAYAARTELDDDLFTKLWTDMVISLNCLSMVLDTEIKQKCDSIIEECKCKSEISFDISNVQKNCPGLKSFKDVYKEQLHELRKELKSMQKQGMHFTTPQTLEAKIITLGTSLEKTETAERIVYTVWQEALKEAENTTEFEGVRREVDKILANIRGIQGVEKIEVTRKCIILAMQCNSPSSLLNLLDYFEQEAFHQCVDYITTELEDGFGGIFVMKANFTMESFYYIKSYANRSMEDNRHEVNIPITFSSAGGMKEVWSVLINDEIKTSTNKISESLSTKLGENISVKMNLNGFHHLFEDTSSSDSISSSSSTAEDISSKEANDIIINDYNEEQWKSAGVENVELLKVNNADEKITQLQRNDEMFEQRSPESTFYKSNISTDSLCGYFESDNMNQSPYISAAADSTSSAATSKESNQQSRIFPNTETYSVEMQPQSNIKEHVQESQGGEWAYSAHTQTQISIGDCIRPLDQHVHGTVGPFVRIKETGELCFLTVRHLFGRLERRDRLVIGNKVMHRHSKSLREVNERICGEVIAAEYSEYLDAALIKISKDHIPNRYSFSVGQEEQYHKAGFTVPKYADIHSVIDLGTVSTPEIEKMRLIKFGSVTGLTQGQFYFTKGRVKNENTTILCKDPKRWIMEAVPYQNYLHVGGVDKGTFALEDDDGAAVYLLDNDSQLHCVGMLCRQINGNDDFLVGQIGVILQRLGKQMGLTLEIDKYEKMGDTIDKFDEDLFNHALQKGLEFDRQIRVNIIGFFAQGKTTLTRRLLNEPLDDITCTDGIDVYVKKSTIHGKTWTHCDTADIYDECSRRLVDVAKSDLKLENEPSVDEAYLTQQSDEERIMRKGTIENVSTPSSAGSNGIKYTSKLSTSGFKENQEMKLGRLFSTHLREKDDETVSGGLLANIWDFGGQFIYYATHQIFHSRDAIYLLVFDLTKDLDMTIIDCDFPDRQEKMKNSLMFLVNSIHAFVGGNDSAGGLEPKIILVGTHKDKFYGDIEKKFEDVIDLFVGTKLRGHIHDKPFSVASINEEDEGVDELRSTIYEMGLKKARLKKVPAKWICLEIAMLEMRDKHILTFEDIISMDAKCAHPITDKTQIKTFLNYHHEKGTIVFFDEDVLNRFVIIDPRFLVNAFKCIITAKWFCRWKKNIHKNWKKLTREAILENDLLIEVWSQENGNNFIEFKDILLLYLERHRILAEIRRMDENTGEIQSLGKYMIPSMLKRDVDRKAMNDFLQDKQFTMVVLGLELGDEVLATVFEKVTAALLGKWPPIEYNGQILVFQNAGLYRIDLQHAGQIVKSDESIELMVINQCPPDKEGNSVFNVVCDRLRRYVEMVISYEYKRNPSYELKKPYKHYFKCNDPWHKGLGSHRVHYVDDIREHTRVCCPDNRGHSINVPEAIAVWFQDNKITDVEANAIRKAPEEDKIIARIAQEYGENWKEFGITIGLSREEMNPIADQNKEVRIHRMIKVWIKKYPKDSDDTLEREMRRYGNGDVHADWDKMRNCLDLL